MHIQPHPACRNSVRFLEWNGSPQLAVKGFLERLVTEEHFHHRGTETQSKRQLIIRIATLSGVRTRERSLFDLSS
jgi:hypothetical protein